jgi:hypothetical protein
MQYSSSTSNASNASSRLVQLLIYHNIVNRLQASTHVFYSTLAERFKSDPAKFASPYTQAIEFTSSILNNDFSTKNSNFMSSLKSSNRSFLTSFLTIIKQKPSFICACLSAMSENDVLAFFSPSSADPFDELSALHRSNALDIIFYSFFPPSAPYQQRFEYFSFIFSFLLNTNPSFDKYDRLCLAILEKITALSSRNHLASLETILLGILQSGQFLIKGTHNSYQASSTPVLSHINLPSPSTPVSSTSSANYSTPNSAFSSPEMAASNYNYISSPSTLVTSPFSPNVISPSISLQRTTAKPTISSSMHSTASKASPNSFHSVDTEFENKRLLFIDNSIIQILSQINNSSTESIPEHMLFFSKVVLASVPEPNQKKVIDFIFFKYFLGRYLYTFFSSPESLSMANDFFISDRQRQRILLAIYNNLYHYAEVVLLNKSSSMNILPAIHNNIMLMYNKFSSLLEKSSSSSKSASSSALNDFTEPIFSTDFQTTEFGSSADISHHLDSRLCSQLLVLSPSDFLTLYASLFPDYALQRQASFAQTATNARPIAVERSGSINSNLNRSSSSSYGYPHTGSIHSSSSGAPGSCNHNFNESLPSLDEINMHFSDDCTSARTTPFFGPEDSKFEWSLNDIRVDVEPVANELLKKFAYLQFRGPGASQYLSFMRPQKLQHFRLPHPLAERWQVFRIEKEGIVEIDEISIVGQFPVYDDLDGGPLKQSNSSNGLEFPMRPSHEESPFMEFEKSPISSSHKVYAEIVTAALEKLISDSSLLKVAGSTNSLFDNNSSDAFNAEFFSNPFDSLSNSKSNDPFLNSNSFSSSSSSTSSPGYLLSILSDAGRRSIALSNYLEGNEYFSAVQALQKLFPSPSSATYIPVANEVNSYLMRCIKRDKENKLKSVARNLKRCEKISQPYQHYLKLSANSCKINIQHLHSLRVKVWYITEVRSSQVWSRARDVTISLNRGTDSVSFEGSESTTRSHTLKRNKSSASLSSASAFSFKRFTGGSKRDYQNKRHSMSHVPTGSIDSMFAPVEYAGHNKLSDKEAEATKNWLDGQKIQIFCASEERIHRFSCEVDDLIKRVIGDASNTRRNRGQSLLTASPLFKSDLCKLIDEIDSMDRSSVVSANIVSKTQFYNLSNNDSATFDSENDLSNRRKSIDNLSIDAFNSSRSKQSSQDLGRSYSGRGHRSRKSSPNLIDMFSSLDMASKRMSSTDLNIDLERSITSESQGHRRNKSLNESSLGNISFTGSEENSAGPVYMDEADRQRHDEKREELDKFLLELQMTVVSLIYTDLGLDGWSEGRFLAIFFFCFFYLIKFANLYCTGSETDKWLSTPIVRESIRRINERNKPKNTENGGLRVNTESRNSWRHSSPNTDSPNYGSLAHHGKLVPPTSLFKFHFPYEKAYSQLIYQLSVNPSPMGKLKALYQLVRLVVSYLSSGSGNSQKRSSRSYRTHSNRPSLENQVITPRITGVEKSVSRKSSLSAMTSLGEAIATVEAKRISSSAFTLQSPILGSSGFSSVGPGGNRASVGPNTDAIAEELQRIFKTTEMESNTLFRDLQFIAAFVPSKVLDLTDMGKAFWDVSLAALSLKEENLLVITQTASELFKRHTGMISTDLSDDFLKKFSLKECAWLWSIASKEGDIEGQRELAMIHFSHPQIAPICVAPFSKLANVFSNTLLDDFRIIEDPDKLDPIRMSIIKHWMSIAASRGDSIAREYLSQQDFI